MDNWDFAMPIINTIYKVLNSKQSGWTTSLESGVIYHFSQESGITFIGSLVFPKNWEILTKYLMEA